NHGWHPQPGFGLNRFSYARTLSRVDDESPIFPATLAAQHGYSSRQDPSPRQSRLERAPRGAGCRDQKLRLPGRRGSFSLDIPFHRTVRKSLTVMATVAISIGVSTATKAHNQICPECGYPHVKNFRSSRAILTGCIGDLRLRAVRNLFP